MDFSKAFERAALIKPGKVFLMVGSETLTYGDLVKRVAQLTRLYRDAGLNMGDRVIIASADDLETIILFFSLLRNGLTAVVLDYRTPAPAARNLIGASEARGILLDEALFDDWQPGGCHFILRIRKKNVKGTSLFNKLLIRKRKTEKRTQVYPDLLETLESCEGPARIPPDIDAYILFTSGTTSQPKGVQISRGSLADHLATLSRQFGYDDTSRLLNVLPLHHADGMIQGPVVAFWNGASLYRPMPFTIQNMGALLDTVYAERITHFIAVPTILSLMLKFGKEFRESFITENFRFIISAAAFLEEELWASIESTFKTRVANVYGLTETVTGGLFSGPTAADHKIGTVGKPVDCQACIVDDNGRELPCGQLGELLIRGGNVMKGYLNAAEATRNVLKDGWLHTGDIASCDAQGFYRIEGRKKNVIITGGINVHPEEITEILNTHPGIVESCTFGVKDDTWGERVVAAVVSDGNAVLTDVALVEYCRLRLAPAKIPHHIYLLPYLPKGPAGKIIIAGVRELIENQNRTGKIDAEGNVRDRMFVIAARCFNAPAAGLQLASSPESVPGWDSLAHLHFVVDLEEAFDIRLTPREIMSIATLHDVERIVSEKFPGR